MLMVTETDGSRVCRQRNGQPCFEFGEEDIRRLFPAYSPEALPECIRQWIEYGIWDAAAINAFISGLSDEQTARDDKVPELS